VCVCFVCVNVCICLFVCLFVRRAELDRAAREKQVLLDAAKQVRLITLVVESSY